jgi:hypothetical protein
MIAQCGHCLYWHGRGRGAGGGGDRGGAAAAAGDAAAHGPSHAATGGSLATSDSPVDRLVPSPTVKPESRSPGPGVTVVSATVTRNHDHMIRAAPGSAASA